MIPVTNEEKEAHEKEEVCHICKEKFCNDENNKKKKLKKAKSQKSLSLYREIWNSCS